MKTNCIWNLIYNMYEKLETIYIVTNILNSNNYLK